MRSGITACERLFSSNKLLKLKYIHHNFFLKFLTKKIMVRLIGRCVLSLSSSSSSAQQPILSQGFLQKLPPAVPIPCSIPPVSPPTSWHPPPRRGASYRPGNTVIALETTCKDNRSMQSTIEAVLVIHRFAAKKD
jgi:hypothetical protein